MKRDLIRRKLWTLLLCSWIIVGALPHTMALGQEALDMQDGFVRVDRMIPDVVQDMRYAGGNNFVGAAIDGYEASVALLTREAALALARVADELRPQGLRLCIYDAYRPERAVAHFVRWAQDAGDNCMQPGFYPSIAKKDLFRKGYIAKKSSHSRGSTVDLTLVDAQGNPLDMGSPFDLFDPISAHNAKGLTQQQYDNRTLLRDAMEKHGFLAYHAEWWHYTLKNEPFPDQSFDFTIQDNVLFAANTH